MYALLLTWDLSDRPLGLLQELRRYISDESWEHYKSVDGPFHKVWLSRGEPREFAAFYRWETEEAREQEIHRMHRVKEITGVDASIARWSVEAAQEGRHGPEGLRSVGLAWHQGGSDGAG